MSTNLRNYELEVPGFFDPNKVAELWRVDYLAREKDAIAWREKHGLQPASQDRVRIALMPIDVQLTFCHPEAALYVAGRSGSGAVDDTRRTAEFIYRNLGVLTDIIPTMDTHTGYQIFHPLFWVNADGQHPDPGTIITLEDVQKGVWKVNPGAAYPVIGDTRKYSYLQRYGLHYVQRLTDGGKYPLMIWPYHAMLGDVDHALVPTLQEASFFHAVARSTQTDYRIKGGNALTENYSPLKPEVVDDHLGRAIAQKNSKFLSTLMAYDYLIIAGQAKSHCVAWAISDLLDEINAKDPGLAKKVYLVEDLTSPVVIPQYDFTDDANAAFKRFSDAGMNVVRSTDPIEDWEGIELNR